MWHKSVWTVTWRFYHAINCLQTPTITLETCDQQWPSTPETCDQVLHETTCNLRPPETCDQLLHDTTCDVRPPTTCNHLWPASTYDTLPHTTCDHLWPATTHDLRPPVTSDLWPTVSCDILLTCNHLFCATKPVTPYEAQRDHPGYAFLRFFLYKHAFKSSQRQCMSKSYSVYEIKVVTYTIKASLRLKHST